MVVPSSFDELGKTARNIFKTGYHYGQGLMRIGVKSTKDPSFSSSGDYVLKLDETKISGSFQSRYTTTSRGSFSEKWSTNGDISLGYGFDGTPKNVGMIFGVNHNPGTSTTSLQFTSTLKNDTVNFGCTLTNYLDTNFSVLGAVVFAFKDLLLGYQAGYDTATQKMTKNDLALAYDEKDVGIHFRCTMIPQVYGLSLYYRVNEDWESALDAIVGKNGDTRKWTLGVATKYSIDANSAFRVKLNQDRQLGTSFQQKLNDDVTLTLSFNVDCANLYRGGHKVGLSLDFEV